MKIAKIIFGAKNTDITSLTALLKVYALAGADIFDVSADIEVINTAKNILNSMNLIKRPKICASITLADDIHSYKAKINNNKCTKCKKCIEICPQNSIKYENALITILESSCTGCKLCNTQCPTSAIEFFTCSKSFEEQFEAAKSADIIEIHTNGRNTNLYDVFKFLNGNFRGEVGICISNNTNILEKIEIIKNIKKIITPKKLIVQADGNSISGFDNEISTTQKAIEESKIFQNTDDIILLVSGGTNEKTAELAKREKVHIDGIAWGSYARKLLRNEENQTTQIYFAKQLTDTVKNLCE